MPARSHQVFEMTCGRPHHSIEGLMHGRFKLHLKVKCSPEEWKHLLELDHFCKNAFYFTQELANKVNKVFGVNIVRDRTFWAEPDGCKMELAADRFLAKGQECFVIERECALDFQVCCCQVKPKSDADGKTLQQADVGNQVGIDILAVKHPQGSWAAPERDQPIRGGDSLLFRFRKCRFTPPSLVVSEEVHETRRLTSEYHFLVEKEEIAGRTIGGGETEAQKGKRDNSYICLPLLQQIPGSTPRKELQLKDLTDVGQMGDGFTLSEQQLRNLGKYLFGGSNYAEVGQIVLPVVSLATECGIALAPIEGAFPGPTVLGTEKAVTMVQNGKLPGENDIHGVHPQLDVHHFLDLRACGLNAVAALHGEPPKVDRLTPGNVWFECPLSGNTIVRESTRFFVFLKPCHGKKKLSIATSVRMKEETKLATMVLLDTSNSMHGSSGFQRSGHDDKLQQLETLQKQGWDDTVPDDNSSEKLFKTIEAFRKHPNLQDLRTLCQNHAYLGSNPFAKAAAMERIAMGILQELCCLEWTKPNVDVDLCRIYTQNKGIFIKILLEDPAATPLDLTGKWCIKITNASPAEVSKKKKKSKKGKAAFIQFAMPVGEYELSLQQCDNRVTSEGKDWNMEGEVEDQSVNFRLIKNGKEIAECLAVISDDGMKLQAGHWTGATIGSGEFVGTKSEVQSGLQAEPPKEFLCPITQQLMEDPVTCADGHSYERSALEHWARTLGHKTSPLTGASLPRLAVSIVKNHALRKQIVAWCLENSAAGSGSKQLKKAELQGSPPFEIFVKTITGKTLSIVVDDETIIIQVKKKIMDSTSIPCNAQRLFYSGKELLANDATLKGCQIQKHACLNIVMTHNDNLVAPSAASSCLPILVTIVDKRNGESMSFLAKLDDTVETILLKCWCAKPHERQPSKVTLWTGMEEDGDNYFTGIPVVNLSTKLSSLPLQGVDADSETLYSAKLEMGITKRFVQMHLRRELSRLQCAQQWLHAYANQSQLESLKQYLKDFINRSQLESVQQHLDAFVNRSQTYNYQNEMGLAVFGDSVEVVSEISSALENIREKVDKIECNGDTSLYDALDKAATKLHEWSRQQGLSDGVSLRVVVLSDGQDNRSTRSASEVQRRLQEHNIIVDAITIGGERDKSLHDIAKATGGSVSQPKSLSDLLRNCELASS